jgi:hypothetical protein
MAVVFTCPECGRQVEVASRLAGHRAPCPNCQVVIRVPGKRGKPSRGLVILATALALAAVGAGVYVWFYYFRGVPDEANPYVQPALPAGYRPTLKIPLPEVPPGDFKTVLYPNLPSSFVLVKTDLWDLKAGQKVGTIQYTVGPAAIQALSADGKYLALDHDGKVAVLTVPAGEEVSRVDYDKSQGQLSYADFPAPDRLTVGKPDGMVEVREIPSGKVLGSFKTGRFQPKQAAQSADGKRLAIFTTDELAVYELPAGRRLLSWSTPPGKYRSLLSANGISFSPDGKELAVLCGLGGPGLLLCWDLDAGRLSGEFPVGPALSTPGAGNLGYTGTVVQWLPDGAGWLLNGHVLFHRPTGRIAWVLRTRAKTNTVALLDRNRLLAPVQEGKEEQLIDIPVPWQQIDTALAALAGPDPVPLRPGQPVSVQADVGALRLGEPEQIQTEIRQALVDRLGADGIPVADNQPTVVYARYQETAGQTLRVHEWAPLQPQRNPPGTAEETKMALEIGFRSREGGEPLWRTYLSQGAGLIVSGKGTTQDVHRDTLDRLKQNLKNTPFPYFLPADARTPQLPLVSQL